MHFFLIIVGVLLIALNIKRPKAKKNEFQLPFNEVLKKQEIDTTDFDIIIGDFRAAFSEAMIEFESQIMEIREELDSLRERQKITVSDKPVEPIEQEIVTNIETPNIENQSNNKINEICELLKKDFPIEEICEKFQMGKGEILLIKELYLR